MTYLVFIPILIALIVVHELGHFFAAKLSGMRVDEFGIGFPPKVWGKKIGETEYTINKLPLGGFVKIFGEDPVPGQPPLPRSFGSKPLILQAFVLIAGIAMNLVFAWVLISATLLIGQPRALTPEEAAVTPGATLAIATVLPGSPAEEAGLMLGDTVLSIEGAGGRYTGVDGDGFIAFVSEHEAGLPLTLTVRTREGEEKQVVLASRPGVVAADPERAAIGLGVMPVASVKTPLLDVPAEGAAMTWDLTKQVAVALAAFFGSLFTFTADISQVSGPLGIAIAVGDASETGIVMLLMLTALISINLALVNLLPIPALDGGRLLFVLIEGVIRRPLPAKLANTVNTVGIGFLMLLMVVATVSDLIYRIPWKSFLPFI